MSTKKGKSISEKYAGKYVATESFNTTKVVASGKCPSDVRKRAAAKSGTKNPVVFFVPAKNSIHIY